ncbi:protein-glutamine gamma-glutamyltransferase [Clostridium arbusti]|uniref:protein-glutamine gamma-glutamyltransferase n=1 Tax=Clostridium arbusti TaxID=1137848 RepID=UPI00028A21F1|nr:protein-glutamine gamma-glutamyltransferase [Clostridium arbusti]
MIRIKGDKFDVNTIINNYKRDSVEREVLDKMSSSREIYEYDSLDELKFELNLRKNTVNAAIDLDKSDFDFVVFRKAKCNTDYWERTPEGGFLLKKGVRASTAINDIYKNSSKYATECATAMVIVYYKAVLDSLGERLFDNVFSNIYLMNWHYIDENLGLNITDNVADYLPGDCMYFKNPQVNPLTPEWQGENVIYLGGDRYYGHGIGIESANTIINELNRERIIWATQSAYLLDSATRPDYKRLAYIYFSSSSRGHRDYKRKYEKSHH